MDSDKVLVMDDGKAAEFDTPGKLLADEKSMFYSLVSNWENSH
jgi:ATP-binding cassette, subfamily C (CFTR/MRP), member 1